MGSVLSWKVGSILCLLGMNKPVRDMCITVTHIDQWYILAANDFQASGNQRPVDGLAIHSILGPKIFYFIFLLGMLKSQRALQIPILNSRNYSLSTNSHLSPCWIPKRAGAGPVGSYPSAHRGQAASSPWPLVMDPYLPVKSRHCRTRRATPMVDLGLGSIVGCVLG